MSRIGIGAKNLVSTSGAAIEMKTPGGIPYITLTVIATIVAAMLLTNKMIPEIARTPLPILPCRYKITAPTNTKSRSGIKRAKVLDNETLGESSIRGNRNVITIALPNENNHPDKFPTTS